MKIVKFLEAESADDPQLFSVKDLIITEKMIARGSQVLGEEIDSDEAEAEDKNSSSENDEINSKDSFKSPKTALTPLVFT